MGDPGSPHNKDLPLSRLLGLPLILLGILSEVESTAAQSGDSKYVPGQNYALPKVPLAPPVTTEPFLGYPPVTTDQRVFGQMLRAGQFAELDSALNQLQAMQVADIRREYDFTEAFGAFDTPDSTIGAAVEAWVLDRPQSHHALVARAAGNLSRAWRIRDRNSDGKLDGKEYREMSRLVGLAVRDSRAALAIDEGDLAAYDALLRAMLFDGDVAAQQGEFERGYARNRGSFILAFQLFNNLQPEYNGSHQAMADFASRIAADSSLNPRLATMAGMMDAHLASDARANRDQTRAMQYIKRAFDHGADPDFLYTRAMLWWQDQDLGRALADLNGRLAQRPQDYLGLHMHGQIVQMLGNLAYGAERQRALQQAKTDYELILAIDPQEDAIREQLRQVDFELKECPEEHGACGGREIGFWRTLERMFRDAKQILVILGAAFFINIWNFVQWIRRKFYLPRYVHLLALAALGLVIVIDIMWVRSGLPMAMRRWMAIPFFPGFVYYLFIGFGGAALAWKRGPGRDVADDPD